MLFWIMLIVLTGVGVFVGINVIYVLVELKKSVEKANRILDNSGDITETFSNTVKSMSSFAVGISAGSVVVSVIKGIGFIRKFTKKKEQE